MKSGLGKGYFGKTQIKKTSNVRTINRNWENATRSDIIWKSNVWRLMEPQELVAEGVIKNKWRKKIMYEDYKL